MNVFRHHHISDQREIIALANFTQNLQEEMPRSFGAQQRHATITTASNKVQLAQSITASEAVLHPQNPNPSNPEGFGTPHGSRELSSELVVWYYPPGRHVNAKNNKKRFATRLLRGTCFSLRDNPRRVCERRSRTTQAGRLHERNRSSVRGA